MVTASATSLTPHGLEKLLRDADPSVVLVYSRLLQRIIREDCKLPLLGPRVPHRKTYVITRDRLLELVPRQELEVPEDQDLPPVVVLLGRPSSDKLAQNSHPDTLRSYWRLLFHANVHKAFGAPEVAARLTPSGLRERIHRIGATRFEEIRAVLRAEKFLLPPADDRSVYVEFAAVYFELRCFAPNLLDHYFPSVPRTDEIDALLGEDIDFTALLERCRPAGASDPGPKVRPPIDASDGSQPDVPWFPVPRHPPLAEAERQALLALATQAAGQGNSVRALVLRTRVALCANETVTRFGSGEDLDQLVGRLQQALRQSDAESQRWRPALRALLARATFGRWPIEARLLYDLQNACLDVERPIHSLDLVEWLIALGKQPLRRPLPLKGIVLQVKHLRSAQHRARGARLPEHVRNELLDLIGAAIQHSEHRLREAIRPLLQSALDEVGLQPQNLPERLAQTKLCEELLDRIVERGIFTLADVRDAIARNRLKLPDLAGTDEFFLGDPLIRLNRRFAGTLAGIYRRGEIYLRWMQRGTSLFFGNNFGRFLTLFLLLPFGGAFVGLYGIHFILHEIQHYAGVPREKQFDFMPHFGEHHHLTDDDITKIVLRVGVCGLFLFGLIHWPAFRRMLGDGLRALWRGVRLIVRIPARLAEWPPVQSFWQAEPVVLFRRYALRPLLTAVTITASLFVVGKAAQLCLPHLPESMVGRRLLQRFAEIDTEIAIWCGALILIPAWLFFNSRLGRAIEEWLLDRISAFWAAIHMDLVPGMVRWLLAVYQRVITSLERWLYTVDEWLRFSTGERNRGVALKAAVGLLWFAIAYVIRFTLNVVAEPQLNPIKHFPVVTVAHKLMLPIMPIIQPKVGWLLAIMVQFSVPGVCGFLAWELRENWRLYRKNQSRTLDPVVIGHHGETMLRFIRPGLHSGTLPKLHARIRKAVRKGNWSTFRRKTSELHHVEGYIRQFLEREFIALLHESRAWGKLPLDVGRIHAGSNHVEVEIQSPRLQGEGLRICFEQQAGWLIAGISAAGWCRALKPEQHLTFTNALAGLYKLCGVDLVREQVSACFRSQKLDWSIDAEGLIVWPAAGAPGRVIYPLLDEAMVHPRLDGTPPGIDFPAMKMSQVLFRRIPIYWESWVHAWTRDQSGEKVKPLVGIRLLPE